MHSSIGDKMTRADLHIHSHHSDGSSSVASIIEYAVRAGMNCIALTDHETMMGVDEAVSLGKERGIRVLPGIEITTHDYKRSKPAHLLCYLPYDRSPVEALCDKTLANRLKQKRQMVEKMSADYPIKWEDTLRLAENSASVYECHIMSVLSDMGYTNAAIGDLKKQLIDSGGTYYVQSVYPDIYDALDAVRSAGGLAVLAHPGQYNSLELAEELAQAGKLDGIELWHPRNSDEVRISLVDLATRYDLITTGGSDFHGSNAHKPHPIGYCRCDEENLKRLIEAAEKKSP